MLSKRKLRTIKPF